MSQRNSRSGAIFWVAVCRGQPAILAAQTAPVEWRRVGNPAMEVGLASPATGPVEAVWYSPDGARLYARTRAGTGLRNH